jgi:hypothetical protein
MKKTLLLILILSVACLSSGQIVTHEIVSSKEYPDNTWTAYLKLDLKIQQGMEDVVTEGILLDTRIKNFSFYNKSDLSKCMFTADKSVSSDMVVDLINEIVQDNFDYISSSFASVWTSDRGKEIYFRIDNIANDIQRKQIEEALLEDDLITNAVINGDDCKIMTTGNFTPEYLQSILDMFGVEINPLSVK